MASANPPTLRMSGLKWLNVCLAVGALYFAREVLVPLALAVLISFLLSPLVDRLIRWHLGKVLSVFIAVHLAFALIGLAGVFVTGQLGDLARKMPEYQENVTKKLNSAQSVGGGVLGRLTKSLESLRQQVLPPPDAPAPSNTQNQEQKEKPVPVEVHNTPFSPLQIVRTVLSSLFSVLGTLFLVVIFVIFMLIGRDDLRRRLIKLTGEGQEDATSHLLDDASNRVIRYLLMQFIVNVGYGVVVGLGLFFIGIPNPMFWGAMSAILRYIPYVGVWIAVAMAFLLGLAVDPGWAKPLMVLGLFVALEIVVANFLEPWVYGTSTGITPLAVLLAAVFWTWLWGPIGLLLSTPITVCLVSVARYFPGLSFLVVLLGEEPRGAPVRHQINVNSGPPPAAS